MVKEGTGYYDKGGRKSQAVIMETWDCPWEETVLFSK